jgi:hypothetical protein
MSSAIYINTNELPIARRAAAEALFDRVNTRAFIMTATNEQADAAEREVKNKAATILDRPEYLVNLLNEYEPYGCSDELRAVEAAVVAAIKKHRRMYAK